MGPADIQAPTRAALSRPAIPVGQRRPRLLGIAREGWPIIIVTIAVWAALVALAWWWVALAGIVTAAVGLIFTVWAVSFFRDPERATPADPNLYISAADGVVSFVGRCRPPAELFPGQGALERTRISVFMNVFNVHVNRSPRRGTIRRVAYKPGKFFNASLDKASEHNERCSLLIDLPDGRDLVLVQVAGLVARRIVCKAVEGDTVSAGERFGMIRFGSRVDVYLPEGATPRVAVGERTTAGLTVLAVDAAGGRP